MLDGIEKIMSGGVCSCGKTHGMATGTAVVGDGAADSLAQFIREKNFQRVVEDMGRLQAALAEELSAGMPAKGGASR